MFQEKVLSMIIQIKSFKIKNFKSLFLKNWKKNKQRILFIFI